MKPNLNPIPKLFAIGEVIYNHNDWCDIRFINKETNLYEYMIGVDINEILSKRNVKTNGVSVGTIINWYRKTYVFLNKKYVYDYFSIPPGKPLTEDALRLIYDEAERLAEKFKDC
jgi:hypothetical protein